MDAEPKHKTQPIRDNPFSKFTNKRSSLSSGKLSAGTSKIVQDNGSFSYSSLSCVKISKNSVDDKSLDAERKNPEKMGQVDDDTLNDPTAFWSAWSERHRLCKERNDGAKVKGCNCFEGLGSVM
mmetsp:Transcript_48423/g.71763  ORF Transcript_48423/g.71763 Transcript_48423/m.71763 type:complete len:124 (-) Transcript_48423:271-642(-)|eukprot:CAMPEP_0195519756 /NCGR_PEP_ID=MMETSP0794_2-20130614/15423_1 /TAXON_ID=515487 /ORGANISM="Stephanopyxis turris, Strain CCMP 815" /LENGTH=123 /DNA_ID=CAMNT_0040648963 /DNA_START=131 /DNA_END=502 /DNA_ORIENTATION=+